MNPFIIAISGAKDHGKSTLGNLLAGELMQNFNIAARVEHLALPMYDMAATFTDDDDFLKDPETAKHRVYRFENRSVTGTEILQDIAQRFGRDYYGGGIWADLWHKRVMSFPHDTIIFTPDCRMPNERSFCDMGIWIEAPGVASAQNMNHETERHLDKMRDEAQIIVVRREDQYNPGLTEIAGDIAVRYSKRTLAAISA